MENDVKYSDKITEYRNLLDVKYQIEKRLETLTLYFVENMKAQGITETLPQKDYVGKINKQVQYFLNGKLMKTMLPADVFERISSIDIDISKVNEEYNKGNIKLDLLLLSERVRYHESFSVENILNYPVNTTLPFWRI